MLKESIKNLIVAIAEGDSLSIENNFNSVMASKISDRLDTMRVTVAQNMFGGQVVEESVELEEDAEQIDELSTKTVYRYLVKSDDSYDKAKKANDTNTVKKRTKGEKLAINSLERKANKGSPFKEELTLEESVELEENKFDHDKAMDIHNKFWDKIEAKLAKKPVKKSDKKPVKEELTLEDFTIEELEEFMMSEEFEQLDELSKQTLGSYIKKAAGGVKGAASQAMMAAHNPNGGHFSKAVKRIKGIEKATDKLTKEELESIEEARRGTFRAGSKSYFKAGQSAIKNIQRAAQERKEKEQQEKVEKSKVED